ncbi:single-stranded DNA-binding protein [Companilactobacillus hulinensis]|uniref:single-stranded DNA-binding protein n=1 Tax=Companilactobacillus hulinensis TaxID=2486007 RepID=UPI000F76CE6D|nr:single-stranded DNA-binding protein [Companilactobacillus hulinensis]
MLNRSILVGRLTKDVDLRYTSNGTAAGSFTLAVNRNYTNAQGEREADFINCVIWRKAAETFSQWTHKGSLVAIDGRLQTRNYENNQGITVYVTELVVDEFSFINTNNGNNNSGSGQSNQQSYNKNNNQNRNNYQNNNSQRPQFGNTSPFGSGQQNSNRSGNNNMSDPFKSGGVNVSDDDLPF